MVCKDIQNNLKRYEYNQLQNLILHLFSCLSLCPDPLLYFLEFIPLQLSYCIILKLLLIRFIITDLLFKFIQAFLTCRAVYTKDKIFRLLFRQCTHLSFCNPQLIYKRFFFCTSANASFYTSKYPYHLNH